MRVSLQGLLPYTLEVSKYLRIRNIANTLYKSGPEKYANIFLRAQKYLLRVAFVFFLYLPLCFSSFLPFACHAYLFLDISFFSEFSNMFSFSVLFFAFSLPILSFICLPRLAFCFAFVSSFSFALRSINLQASFPYWVSLCP